MGDLAGQNRSRSCDIFGVGEQLDVRGESGERKISVTRDPEERSLCSSGQDRVDQKISLSLNQTVKLRLGVSMFGAPLFLLVFIISISTFCFGKQIETPC